MTEPEPAHATERHRRVEREAIGEVAVVALSVCERWCAHCRQWVMVRGVSGTAGEIAWMLHDANACPQKSVTS